MEVLLYFIDADDPLYLMHCFHENLCCGYSLEVPTQEPTSDIFVEK